MIILKRGNIFDDEADALVNAVNCVGVMGAGIAKQFKRDYPDMFTIYEEACRKEEVQLGRMHVVEVESLFHPKFIINFPTKHHWKNVSKLEDIESGLVDLVRVVKELGIKTIAIPPLGCGLGGLKWSEVRPLIEKAFKKTTNVHVHLYEPL